MKLLPCLCVFILSSFWFWQEIYGQLDPPKNITFPKYRKQIPSGRIIGGQEVTPHSFPFQVALRIFITDTTYIFCGGTLISTEWVLTAAHCLDDPDIHYVQVYLGSHYVTATFEDTRLVLNSTNFMYHTGWNAKAVQNDIALVRLPINVTLNENIKTVKFTRSSTTYANQIGSMLGWGLLSDQPPMSNVLRIVNSNILTNEECNSGYFVVSIASTHICVSGTGYVGTCYGDSGGPLLVDGVQVGITSFGSIDCSEGYPSVFTRISEYESWIKQYTGISGSHKNLHYSIEMSIVFCLYFLFTSIRLCF